MNDGCFSFRLGIEGPNPAVLPGPLLQMLTPQDPNRPVQPQNQGTTKRRSIMLPSTSLASGHRRPRSPGTSARNMQKSGSTDGPLGCGAGVQAGGKGRVKERMRKRGQSLSLSLSFLTSPRMGHPIPDLTFATA